MPRQTALINPVRPIAPLLKAATVLLLRDGAQGVEVLMTRRSLKASFAPGVYVFPGGGIEADDERHAINARLDLAGGVAQQQGFVAIRPTQSPKLTCWALAAIRESFEEVGIVLAKHSDGSWITQEEINQLDRGANFYMQMQQHHLTLAGLDVFLLAHWITDRDMPKRFEVPFLVARVPPGQTPVADEKEQFAPVWVRPDDALLKHEAKQFAMIFPTVRTLKRISDFKCVDDILDACSKEKPLWTSCPRAGLMAGKEVRLMEHEAAFGELAMVAPYGQITHSLDWQHERPVQLLRHVRRLTAPNPSLMTGPGTNTYIVGTPEKGYMVIDPGPDSSAHIERIMRATGGDIVAIVCTHSHADHSPAAKPLQVRVVEASNTVPMSLTAEFAKHICPILGLPSMATANKSAWFEPDVALRNMEQLAPYFRRPYDEAPFEISLQVIHTPGHAANHICLISPEDGLLFSGDHILNGSTTVIDPPDGDMTAYLDSLETLQALSQLHDLRFILPAHGYVLSMCDAAPCAAASSQEPVPTQRDNQIHDSKGGAYRAIAALHSHRLQREAKIIAAMKSIPDAGIDELLPLAYDDVDPTRWPIARRSLLAHMQRITEKG